MKNISKYIINENATIKDALIQLNNLGDTSLALFVVDNSNKIVGSLTDGDIRRKLISGIALSEQVTMVMHRNFKYIVEGQEDVVQFQKWRQLGITLLPYLNQDQRIIDIFDLNRKLSLLPIDAVLMAGGKGERLRPLTEKTPKPLLTLGDKAIIDHNVERLITYGVQDIFVTVNYLHEQIEQHFEKECNGIKVQCIKESKYLGTIGSAKLIPAFNHDTILIMNSDLFTNIDYEEFYLYFTENDADMAVAAVPYSVSVPYGIFEYSEDNISGITEKPTYTYYANAGIYLIKKELLNLIPEDAFFNATDFMEMLIYQKKKVIKFPITGYWIDIGKKEDYAKAVEIVKHI